MYVHIESARACTTFGRTFLIFNFCLVVFGVLSVWSYAYDVLCCWTVSVDLACFFAAILCCFSFPFALVILLQHLHIY